jgi:hypothetical protein
LTAGIKPLTFSAVDGLAFAATTGGLEKTQSHGMFTPTSLGPLLEFLYLLEGERLPAFADRWVHPNGASSMIAAFREDHETWVSPDARRMGFIRTRRRGADADHRLTAFLMIAQRAAREIALLPGKVPAQLAGAMEEMENNIHEHAEAPETGLLAFRAAGGVFEFVAADRGMGLLASLQRCSEFKATRDHGKALEAALTDGTSRHGSASRHGHGFRPVFLGLMNLQGSLRFRSGDHALLMDGTSPTLATAQLAQKPFIDGFFASIRCNAVGQSSPVKNVRLAGPNQCADRRAPDNPNFVPGSAEMKLRKG